MKSDSTQPAPEPSLTAGHDATVPEAAPRSPAPRLVFDEELAARGADAWRALDATSPDAAADERILHELAAKQFPLALLLHELEAQLATRMVLVMDDPRLALALAKVLEQTVSMASAMSRRVQATLSTAASLRAQRRFLKIHGRAPVSRDED